MLGSFLKWILSLFLGSTEPEVQEEPDVQEETEEKPDLSLEQDTEFKQDEPIHDNELELEVEKKIFTKSSKKKGLLVGINYNNDNYKNDDLNGCENDMVRLSQWIQNKCHFEESDITTLDSVTATKENMIKEIKELVNFAKANPKSELWFSYSGHGSHYFSAFEKDNQDEIICPVDYNSAGFISDNWFKSEFVDKLPLDCKLFVIMDCCHSGSNMDLPYCLNDGLVATRYNVDENEKLAKVIKLSGCLDAQVSMDYYNSKMGEFQGAFTNAFVMSFNDNIMLNYVDDLNSYLTSNSFKQISELSMSEPSLWAWKVC